MSIFKATAKLIAPQRLVDTWRGIERARASGEREREKHRECPLCGWSGYRFNSVKPG